MFRILHFADLHLDASFAASGLPTTVGTWRRVDLKDTLDRILSLAHERQVDAITIAGDLYEQDHVLPDTIDWLRQQFAKLAPIQVFIAPGERDSYKQDSLYTLNWWPEECNNLLTKSTFSLRVSPRHSSLGCCPPSNTRS